MAASTPFLEASYGEAGYLKSVSPRAALPMSSGTCSPARALRSLSRNRARRCSRGPHGGGVEPSSAPHLGSAGRGKAPKGGLLLPTLLPGQSRHPGRENRGPNLTSLPPSGPSTPDPRPGTPVRLTRPPRPTNAAGATPPCRQSRAAHLEGTGPARAQSQAPSSPDANQASSPNSHSARVRGMEVGVGSDSEVLTARTSGPLHPRLPLPGLHRLRASLNAANPLPNHPNASLKD